MPSSMSRSMDSQYEAAQAPPTAMVAAESLSCQQEASLLLPEALPNPPPVCIGLGLARASEVWSRASLAGRAASRVAAAAATAGSEVESCCPGQPEGQGDSKVVGVGGEGEDKDSFKTQLALIRCWKAPYPNK